VNRLNTRHWSREKGPEGTGSDTGREAGRHQEHKRTCNKGKGEGCNKANATRMLEPILVRRGAVFRAQLQDSLNALCFLCDLTETAPYLVLSCIIWCLSKFSICELSVVGADMLTGNVAIWRKTRSHVPVYHIHQLQ